MRNFYEEYTELSNQAHDAVIAMLKEHGERCEMWLSKARPFKAYRLKVNNWTLYHPIAHNPTQEAQRVAPYRGVWYYSPYSDGREHYTLVRADEIFSLADDMAKQFNK